jgi:hypothetical protein
LSLQVYMVQFNLLRRQVVFRLTLIKELLEPNDAVILIW